MAKSRQIGQSLGAIVEVNRLLTPVDSRQVRFF